MTNEYTAEKLQLIGERAAEHGLVLRIGSVETPPPDRDSKSYRVGKIELRWRGAEGLVFDCWQSERALEFLDMLDTHRDFIFAVLSAQGRSLANNADSILVDLRGFAVGRQQ